MSLDKAKLCDSLLTWLQTFQVPSCDNKHDLTSGVAIAHVLHRIDPSWFNETWLGRIKEESEANWRLKVSNLKKVLKSMLEYYHDVLGQQVSDEHLPDVNLIGELGDVTELGKLLQLVLGCAVSCEKKQEQIQQIMTLEESVQHVVMTAIQELLAKEPTSEPGSPETYGDFDYQSRKYYFLSEEAGEKEDLTQRCRDLEHQLSLGVEERSSLQAEVRSLRERLSRSDSLDAATTAITGKKLLLLQSQMEQLQEENYRLENGRDDLRVRADMLEREVADLQQRNEELTSLAHEAQALKDEMDILRHSSDRVNQLEALVETYKRKLEDLGDLRRQVRLLEERNTVYMQRTCELEEELRRANAVRGQLDTYKRQAHELHTRHTAEAMKAEKWQFEYKNLYDKYDALLKEKERLISERDSLREANDELRCAQVQQGCLSGTADLSDGDVTVGNLAAEIMPTELKETVVRLQSENKMLCAQEETYRQKLVEVQAELEEAQRSKNSLETQNRLNQQQISELRSQVEELQKALQQQDSKHEDSSLLKKKLEEHLEKLNEAHSDLRKKREVIDDLEPKADSNMAKKIDELQEILRKKDEDMKQMEQRYKRYMEKARTVIKTLDPKQPAPTPDVQSLRNQLTEKERKLQHLEHDYERSRARHSQEEKLIISAWYNMVGHGVAPAGVGRAAGTRKPGHVLPGPAETVHQRPARPGPPAAQMRRDGTARSTSTLMPSLGPLHVSLCLVLLLPPAGS
ncbi:PREDICTED: protein Hook homolog 2-like isoform X3 [Poecilia mexicana]|uniref:protein Hook homolog 2-like isoform X3 n=1 Tax=Poecilia mexicana TaxID=48701 RepID=UPI00072E6022|nr:PREDICTED: protein Hook homolog 2-like isoform X3 [Poecilia mexicana]